MGRAILIIIATLLAAPLATARAETADDYLRPCGGFEGKTLENCQRWTGEFKEHFAKAMRGDYEGEMIVGSWLRQETKDGSPVDRNPPLGCAWMMVGLASGSAKLDYGDVKVYGIACENKLTATEMAVARMQAQRLFEAIYHKPLPSGF